TCIFIFLPSTFLSTMMMSVKLMPGWIRAAARWNPVNWAVVAARDGFEGRADPVLGLRLGLLAAFAGLCAALATGAVGRSGRPGGAGAPGPPGPLGGGFRRLVPHMGEVFIAGGQGRD